MIHRPRRRPSASRPPARRLPPLLRRAWYALNQAFRRRIAHLELTPDQYTVLRILDEENGGQLTQRELTEQMFSDPNTIASLVNRMEAAGLILRTPHARDRRAVQLRLGTAGRGKLTRARRLANALQEETLAILDEAGQGSFLEQLEKFASSCQDALSRSSKARATGSTVRSRPTANDHDNGAS
ncbi:MAG: MarR family winged helix-turn-helix transcriptional regulator [Limisphaerales bacterium]